MYSLIVNCILYTDTRIYSPHNRGNTSFSIKQFTHQSECVWMLCSLLQTHKKNKFHTFCHKHTHPINSKTNIQHFIALLPVRKHPTVTRTLTYRHIPNTFIIKRMETNPSSTSLPTGEHTHKKKKGKPLKKKLQLPVLFQNPILSFYFVLNQKYFF